MGYFSWNCLACGFSVRECRNCSQDDWMGHAVVLAPNGTRVIGHYDGYGRVGDSLNLANQMGDFSVYHKACWELSGKPEFTKQSPHARDQGACLPIHGQPLPVPKSPEWFHVAKTWHVLDRLLHVYGEIACEMHHDEAKRQWDSFTPDEQAQLTSDYETAACVRRAKNKASWEAYLHSDVDEEMPPEKESEPKTFTFKGVEMDYMWLGHMIYMAKKDR
jgi:hypothetical protein